MPESIEPNHEFLRALSEGPESHMDPKLAKMIADLVGKPQQEVRQGLHQALDYGARYALCSDFIMNVMRFEWERIGGRRDDPAPWRDELELREGF